MTEQRMRCVLITVQQAEHMNYVINIHLCAQGVFEKITQLHLLDVRCWIWPFTPSSIYLTNTHKIRILTVLSLVFGKLF